MSFTVRAAELTQLQLENPTTPGTFLTLGTVLTVDAPELSYESVEASPLGPGKKQFRQSNKGDNGELGFTFLADPADTTSAVTYAMIRDLTGVHNWRVVYEAGTATSRPCDTIPAFITKFKRPGGDADSNCEGECTLKVTGDITAGSCTFP